MQSLEIGTLAVPITGCVHYFKYAWPLSMAGVVLGIAILPPALVILAMMIETQLLRFIQLKSLLDL